jgi:hypothetical protein
MRLLGRPSTGSSAFSAFPTRQPETSTKRQDSARLRATALRWGVRSTRARRYLVGMDSAMISLKASHGGSHAYLFPLL